MYFGMSYRTHSLIFFSLIVFYNDPKFFFAFWLQYEGVLKPYILIPHTYTQSPPLVIPSLRYDGPPTPPGGLGRTLRKMKVPPPLWGGEGGLQGYWFNSHGTVFLQSGQSDAPPPPPPPPAGGGRGGSKKDQKSSILVSVPVPKTSSLSKAERFWHILCRRPGFSVSNPPGPKVRVKKGRY